jgi:hypothetical protein
MSEPRRWLSIDTRIRLRRPDCTNVSFLPVETRHVCYHGKTESKPVVVRRCGASLARFADLNAQFYQLAVDPRSSPQWVLPTHAPNELAHFFRNYRSATFATATLPRPEQAKSLAMPANDCFGPYDHQRASPFRPSLGKPSPKPTIRRAQLRSFHRTLQHGQLVTKSHDFDSAVPRDY